MYRVRWREIALAELEDIAQYIAEDNPYAAMKVVSDIHAATKNMIAFMPRMFPTAHDNREVRMCALVRPYLIFYRILENDNTIEIMDVIHAARNIRG